MAGIGVVDLQDLRPIPFLAFSIITHKISGLSCFTARAMGFSQQARQENSVRFWALAVKFLTYDRVISISSATVQSHI